MIDSIKLEIKNKLEAYYKEKYNVDLQIVVEEPKKAELGDISVPMFAVVKTLRKPMPEIVSEALEAIKSFNLPISDIKSVGAFVNLFVDTGSTFHQFICFINLWFHFFDKII